jgi:uncharacterized membrane protein YphA (DoxX/SURF4 family)
MTSQLLLDWLGRVLMAALFVKAVPGKVTDFSGTVDVIASKGIAEPFPWLDVSWPVPSPV